MQEGFIAWLELPIVAIFASLLAFYLATALLLAWLSFRSPLSRRILSFKGVVAPFFVSTAIMFGLLIGFLSGDIWERNKQASRVVLTESDTLLALYSLGTASGADDGGLRTAIRAYVRAVVDDEWPRLAVTLGSFTTNRLLAGPFVISLSLPARSRYDAPMPP